MATFPDLSLIIPAYNEGSRIGNTIEGLRAFAQAWPPTFQVEILFVLDGCSDDTAQIIRNADAMPPTVSVRLLELPINRGKGATVKAGVAQATGRVIGFTDADLPYALDAVPEIVAKLQCDNGPDLIVGARDLPESQLEESVGIARLISGRAYSLLVRALLRTGLADTQCGFKFFRGPLAKRIFSKVTIQGFGFDVEVIHIARLNGLKVKRVPVRLVNVAGSSVRLLRDSTRMFADIMYILLRDARRAYLFPNVPHDDASVDPACGLHAYGEIELPQKKTPVNDR